MLVRDLLGIIDVEDDRVVVCVYSDKMKPIGAYCDTIKNLYSADVYKEIREYNILNFSPTSLTINAINPLAKLDSLK